ncbi:hypothetical protein Bpfe_010581, partial [Biomphalaria pfeifferi]
MRYSGVIVLLVCLEMEFSVWWSPPVVGTQAWDSAGVESEYLAFGLVFDYCPWRLGGRLLARHVFDADIMCLDLNCRGVVGNLGTRGTKVHPGVNELKTHLTTMNIFLSRN